MELSPFTAVNSQYLRKPNKNVGAQVDAIWALPLTEGVGSSVANVIVATALSSFGQNWRRARRVRTATLLQVAAVAAAGKTVHYSAAGHSPLVLAFQQQPACIRPKVSSSTAATG